MYSIRRKKTPTHDPIRLIISIRKKLITATARITARNNFPSLVSKRVTVWEKPRIDTVANVINMDINARKHPIQVTIFPIVKFLRTFGAGAVVISEAV